MLQLEITKTDINELIGNAIDLIKHEGEKKQVEILLDIDATIPRYAYVDGLRLKQILVNLLSNAVKFTEKGEIELKVIFQKIDSKLGKFLFSVRDTGIGIADSQKDKLFKAFSQADSSTTRKFGGTGLGLIISEKLARKMGTTIRFESYEGKGTTFMFDIVSQVEIEPSVNKYTHIKVKRSMIIDDNHTNCFILEKMLEQWGIQTLICHDASSALSILEKEKDTIDLIICDYQMPSINGIETIQMIRDKLHFPAKRYPVILLYSSVDAFTLYNRENVSVDMYLVKPVKADELFHLIKDIESGKIASKSESSIVQENQPQATLSENKKIILIAEDNEFNMLLAKALVADILPEAVIIEAINGKNAVERYVEYSPDIILMDVQMPIMGGIEATIEIRKLDMKLGKHTPIIALTANSITEEREKCLNVGMDEFLSKPIATHKLAEFLNYFLS
ncbi:MAG: response regulator [Bacteroidales bacterium]|nr:response regulator [Bacteroidales bacterium]